MLLINMNLSNTDYDIGEYKIILKQMLRSGLNDIRNKIRFTSYRGIL